MRDIIAEQPVQIELASSAVGPGITWAAGDEIPFGTFAATSTVKSVRVKFDASFDEAAVDDGLYRPRFWIQNLPGETNMEFEQALVPLFPDTTLAAGSAAPVAYQDLENITMPAGYIGADDALGIIQLQVIAGLAYDTTRKDKADPVIMFEWERQDVGQLGSSAPSPNSDHLFEYTDVGMFVETITTGSSVKRRWEIGWFVEEDFNLDIGQDQVLFKKGKPKATIVKFMSEVRAMATGTTKSFDPWFTSKLLRIAAVKANNKIRYTEKNKQRPIETFDIFFEWFTNSGHLVQIRMPKAQIVATGQKAPGGSEIASCTFEVTALVTQKGDVYEFSISESPVQRASCPLTYTQTAA